VSFAERAVRAGRAYGRPATLLGAVGLVLPCCGPSRRPRDFGRYATVTAPARCRRGGSSDGGVDGRRPSARASAFGRVGRSVRRLMRNLVTLRLDHHGRSESCLRTGFAIVAGYDRQMVLGTLLGGIGVVFINTQTTMGDAARRQFCSWCA